MLGLMALGMKIFEMEKELGGMLVLVSLLAAVNLLLSLVILGMMFSRGKTNGRIG